MKKAIVLSVLGLATSGFVAFGQGQIQFNNYNTSTYQPVYYNPTASLAPTGMAGANADSTTEVQLFYAIGTYSSASSFMAAATAGNTTFIASTLNGGGTYMGSPAPTGAKGGPGGYYNGPIQILNGWAAGDTVTFMLQGWETAGADGAATYAQSLLKGQSALWTESSSIVSAVGSPAPTANYMQNGPAALMLSLGAAPVPEPTTLAFAGMGMLSLLALARRKKA